MCIDYLQPIARGELGQFFGKQVSRNTIGHLRRRRSALAAAGIALHLCHHQGNLSHFGFDTLSDLSDMEALENAGLLSKDRLLAGDIPVAGLSGEEADSDAADAETDLPE